GGRRRGSAGGIAAGSPPPSRSTRSGTLGRNTGRTTPTVLLYTETNPVTSAIRPVTDRGVASCAISVVNALIPPVFSRSAVNTVTPQTITITLQGIPAIAARSSPNLARISTKAMASAPIPTCTPNPTTPTTRIAIPINVTICEPDILSPTPIAAAPSSPSTVSSP